MRRPLFFKFLTGLSFFLVVSSAVREKYAWAHAYPAFSFPGDGAVLSVPPAEARIQFTEGIELEFSRIDVKNSAGDLLSRGKVRRIARDTLAIDLKSLLPGFYVIEWQVLSVDTHITEGVLRFTVKPNQK